MAILITGLGYLGVPLAQAWLERGQRVVGLENFFSTSPRSLAGLRRYPGFRLVRGSVGSWRALGRAFSGESIDRIYHLAAQASSHSQAASPGLTETFNLLAPRRLWEAVAAHGVRTVVLASSFRVYGSSLEGLVSEATPYGLAPDLAHLTKVYAEKLLELYAVQLNWRAVALRLGITYGLGPVMKADPRFMTVPHRFCQQAANGEFLQVHRGASRPMGFIHLQDAVAALMLAGEQVEVGYQPANAVGEVRSVPHVAALVGQVAAQRGLIVRIEGVNQTMGGSFRSTSILERLGFRPRIKMEQGLPPVLDYFLAQRADGAEASLKAAARRGTGPRATDEERAEGAEASFKAVARRGTSPRATDEGEAIGPWLRGPEAGRGASTEATARRALGLPSVGKRSSR